MYSTFFGLEIANRALSAYQGGLDVTGHNIANANTAGYTRQLANIQATTPLSLLNAGKQITLGTGSTIDNVIRARDSYVDRQYRWETSKNEYWSGKETSLSMVEGLMNEPTDYSLHDDLDKFWNAWSELAKDPQNSGARAVVKERAMTVADTFHNINQQITDLQSDLDSSVELTVEQINNIADQIKELNIQIKNAEVSMDNANDLKDKRDALVDNLAKLVPVRVVETNDPNFTDRVVGNYKIIIGNDTDPNNVLVDDQAVKHLQDNPVPIQGGFFRVVWEGSDATDPDEWVDLGTNMGKLQADIEIRDQYMEDFRDKFNLLAQGLAVAVNTIHETGQGLNPPSPFTGIPFFTDGTDTSGITAENITINSVIEGNKDYIATGKITDPTEVGDGSVALAIASLSDGWAGLKEILGSDILPTELNDLLASSFGDYYSGLIAGMGVDVEQSTRMAEGQAVLVTHMSNLRESASGVSLDEEMANLVKFQKSYSAAARIVTMMDTMLDTILGMGVTR